MSSSTGEKSPLHSLTGVGEGGNPSEHIGNLAFLLVCPIIGPCRRDGQLNERKWCFL